MAVTVGRPTAQNPAYRSTSHLFLPPGPLHEPRSLARLDRPPLAAGGAAGRPGHAGSVLDRHLPAGLHRHRAKPGGPPGRDAADAVGLPDGLRPDEPVP